MGPGGRSDKGGTQLPRTLDTLTSLRFFAAFAVFTHHFTGTGGGTGTGRAPLLFPHSMLGGHGVTFFFVLSGFVLTWSFRPWEHPMSFYWRRVGRIWPVHIVALLLTLAVWHHLGKVVADWPSFWASVVLIQNWFPKMEPARPGNGVTWSLSVELLFYALVPFIVRTAHRCPTRTLIQWTASGLTAMYAFTWWARTHLATADASWALRHPVFYLPVFLSGVVIAVAVLRGWRWSVPPIFAVALIAAYSYALYKGAPHVSQPVATHLGYALQPVLTVLSGMVILGFAVRELEDRPTAMTHPVLVAFGTWSYSFFLIHQPIRHLLLHEGGRVPDDNYAILTMIGLALLLLALSALVYTFIERPSNAWMTSHVPVWWRRGDATASGGAVGEPHVARVVHQSPGAISRGGD